MKRLGISQRVEVIKSYGERRDCLDQQWSSLAMALDYFPVPLPNIRPDKASELLNTLQLDGIILSGGNSLSSLDSTAEDAAPERDAFEYALIEAAIAKGIPIVGVCRGMQVLNLYLKGTLQKVTGHVATRHRIVSSSEHFTIPENVNSFHNYSIPKNGLAPSLTSLAHDETGNIEAFYQIKHKILGIMWHPEREENFTQLDIQLIKRFLL